MQSRRFVAAPPRPLQTRQPQPQSLAQSSSAAISGTDKRKRGSRQKKREPVKQPAKRRNTKAKGKRRAVSSESEEEDIIDISSDEDEVSVQTQPTSAPLRRSSRKTNVAAGGYNEEHNGDKDEDPIVVDSDIEMSTSDGNGAEIVQEPLEGLPFDAGGLITMDADNDVSMTTTIKSEDPDTQLVPQEAPEQQQNMPAPGDNADMPLELDVEEEEEKPKPILKLRYQGFNIHGKCLCVIVEPYPPIRSPTRAVSLAPTGVIAPRAPSIAPADYVPQNVAAQRRARTPLFLPEDDRDRSVTPAPWGGHEDRVLPPVPLFSEEPAATGEEERDFEGGGMFELSQILQSVGDYPAGTAEDDDEIDGAALFGDADEVRGL